MIALTRVGNLWGLFDPHRGTYRYLAATASGARSMTQIALASDDRDWLTKATLHDAIAKHAAELSATRRFAPSVATLVDPHLL